MTTECQLIDPRTENTKIRMGKMITKKSISERQNSDEIDFEKKKQWKVHSIKNMENLWWKTNVK